MNKKLGLQIKNNRLKKRMSLSKLATIAGISKSYLSSIENHETNPSAHIIQKIAKALEVPVEQLLSIHVGILDPEWVDLVLQARDLGLNKEDIRDFLAYESWKCSDKEGV
ncbi:helix-turn-helix domain-containing protein [Fictibacillus phosphorivorans]|uniref:helix-turn-helix domain-containing protein n=1 Tax=Fictibacillus phosphorivorans TaxID=1221500 RepID=UPI0012E84875|nr:helix-turn-helix domain-containing protein [Fictibacillus phosphorivorans]